MAATSTAQRIAQEREVEALLAARWGYTDIVNHLRENREVSERTAKRRIAAVYKKLDEQDFKTRRRALAVSQDAARRECQRLRGEIARLGTGGGEAARVREKLSKTLLSWEKHLLELHGVRPRNIDEVLEGPTDEEGGLPLSRDEALLELAGDLTDEELQQLIAIRAAAAGDG